MRLSHAIAILIVHLLPVAVKAQQPTTADSIGHHRTGHPNTRARITEDSARTIALARVPNGQVKSAELEREHGRLVYSFDIAVPGKAGVEEILVSAHTGHIVSTKHESPESERAEQLKEQRERHENTKKKAKRMSGDSSSTH